MTIAYIDQTVAPVKTFPAQLFFGGQQGAWYDPSDRSTLFQDTVATIPVTADGQLVALMRDKSGNGNHLVQATMAARPIYRTDGNLHWLEGDGVDDSLIGPSLVFGAANYLAIGAETLSVATNNDVNVFGLNSGNSRFWWNVVSTAASHLIGGIFRRANGTIRYGSMTGFSRQSPYVGDMSWAADGAVRIFAKAANGAQNVYSNTNSPVAPDVSLPIQLFGNPIISNRFFGGLLVGRSPLDSERALVREYLASKTGVML